MAIGDRIDGWRVCWIGGRDKCRVPFVVMVDRPLARGAIPVSKLRNKTSFFRDGLRRLAVDATTGRHYLVPLKLRATAIIAVDNPILHHKIHLLRDFDIVKGVSWNAHYIGQHARL